MIEEVLAIGFTILLGFLWLGGGKLIGRLLINASAEWENEELIDPSVDPWDAAVAALGLTPGPRDGVAATASGAIRGLDVKMTRNDSGAWRVCVHAGPGFFTNALSPDDPRRPVYGAAWARVFPYRHGEEGGVGCGGPGLVTMSRSDGLAGAGVLEDETRKLLGAVEAFEAPKRGGDVYALRARLSEVRDERALNGLSQVLLEITAPERRPALCRELLATRWLDAHLTDLACRGLPEDMDPHARAALVTPLLSRSADHGDVVLAWLTELGDEAALELLERRYLAALDKAEVREVAPRIARFPAALARRAWLAGLGRSNEAVRDEAARRLARDGSPLSLSAAEPVLLARLDADDEDEVRWAVNLLGRPFGSLASVAPLMRLAEREWGDLEHAARTAIAAIQERHGAGDRGGLSVVEAAPGGGLTLSSDEGELSLAEDEG